MDFSDRAATWDDDPEKLRNAAQVAEAVRRNLGLTGTEDVLEFGGGTGLLSRALADDVGTVVITDAAPGMVAVAQQRIDDLGRGDRMRAALFDPTAADADPGRFDVVWSMLALHHVPDIDVALARLRGLLKPGGRLALADLDEDPGGSFHQAHGDFHGHDGFDRHTLGHALQRIGFQDIAFDTATTVDKEVDGARRSYPVFLVTARVPR